MRVLWCRRKSVSPCDMERVETEEDKLRDTQKRKTGDATLDLSTVFAAMPLDEGPKPCTQMSSI